MKILNLAAAGLAGLAALATAAPAAAQDGYHHDHRVVTRTVVVHHDYRRPYHGGYRHGFYGRRGYGWHRGYGYHRCFTTWYHHHPVRHCR